MNSFLSDLSCFFKSSGFKLIGHFKGLLHTEKNGHLFFSITSFGEKPRFKGNLEGDVASAMLTIAINAYGLDLQSVEKAVCEAINNHFPERT